MRVASLCFLFISGMVVSMVRADRVAAVRDRMQGQVVAPTELTVSFQNVILTSTITVRSGPTIAALFSMAPLKTYSAE